MRSEEEIRKKLKKDIDRFKRLIKTRDRVLRWYMQGSIDALEWVLGEE